jgi:hypothetical protein
LQTSPRKHRFPIRLTMKSQTPWPERALDSGFVAFPFGKPVSTFPGNALVLLRHKFLRRVFRLNGAAQHGHRDKVLATATIRYRCIVAIEFGICRSGRKGGASGSVTVGNGKLREDRGGARS